MSNQARLACDRCRDQKLRCQRVERPPNDETCARCRRAGALCVTSSPRRLGRPRTRASVQQGASVSSAYDSPAIHTTLTETVAVANVAPENMLDPSADILLHGANRPGCASINNDYDGMAGYWPPASLPDEFLNFQMPSGMDDLLQTANTPLQLPDSTSQSVDLAHTTGRGNSNWPLSAEHTMDPIVRLSQLNERLARYKVQIETYPRDLPPDLRVCANKAYEVESNPMVQALDSASEFVAVLEWLAPKLRTWTSVSPTTTSTSSTPASLGSENSHCDSNHPTLLTQPEAVDAEVTRSVSTPIMLLLLSSYLQTIELYDSIFARICQVLQGLPDKIALFQGLPQFRIAGFPPMKPQLYIRVVVQVSEAHLHSIERLMGLPPEFCLSTQRISTKGIFSGVDSSALLQNVLSATLVVSSLKESLHSLHTLLPA